VKRAFLITVLLVALVPLLGFAITHNDEQAPTDVDLQCTVVVQKGDTLWSIAETFREPHTDIRRMVYMIRKANDLHSAVVYPGQKLTIPVAKH